MVTVTEELLRQGMSDNGAWNMAQLRALGVPTISFNKGWKHRLIGSQVTQSQVDEFLRLKNRHLAHKKRNLPQQGTFEKEMFSHLNSIKQEIKNSANSCQNCFHHITKSCEDSQLCDYWYNPNSKIQGKAYKLGA